MVNGEPTVWDLQRQIDRNDRDARDRDADRRLEVKEVDDKIDAIERERREEQRWKMASVIIPTLAILVSVAAVIVSIVR